MYYFELLKKNLHYYFLDHKVLRIGSEYFYMLFMCVLSALVYGIGFRSFISMSDSIIAGNTNPDFIARLATGGVSGLSQCVVILCELFGLQLGVNTYNTLQAIFYLVLNIPLLIFSFFKIGIKFGFFTTLNVICCSVFINYLPYEFFDSIAAIIQTDYIARSVFAGICTGLSSALAFKGNLSAGGVDILAYYISLRKSETSGKYIVLFNSFVITTFTILLAIQSQDKFNLAVVTALYSITYLFMSSLVVDAINVRNKKVQIQVVTSNEHIYRLIVANLPHSCTIMKGIGGNTGQEKYVIYAVVSNSEVNSIVKKIRKIDPLSFIMTTSMRQVYGRFFIKPIE